MTLTGYLAAVILAAAAAATLQSQALPPNARPGLDSRPALPPLPRTGSAPAPESRPAMPPAPMNVMPVKPAPGQEPKIVFDEEFHEFGSVDEGPELETQFTFRNDGKGDLYILTELRHCGCAVTWYEVNGKPYEWGQPIPPGAKGTVHFVMKTVGFSGEKPSEVDVFTNDPSRPPAPGLGQGPVPFGTVPLRVRTTIRKLFEFQPSAAVSIGAIVNYKKFETSVALKSLHGKPFEVLGFEPATDPLVQYRAEAVDAEKTHWKVHIEIAPGRDPSAITKIVKVLTKPEIPNAMLYVIGTLKGSVDTEPVGMLPLGNFNRAEGASRTLRVVNSNPAETLRVANVRLLDVRDPKALRGEAGAKPCDSAVASHVKVHYEETIPGKQGQVVVQVKETMPAGPFSFRVAFDTGIAGGPAVFSIPVTGLAK